MLLQNKVIISPGYVLMLPGKNIYLFKKGLILNNNIYSITLSFKWKSPRFSFNLIFSPFLFLTHAHWEEEWRRLCSRFLSVFQFKCGPNTQSHFKYLLTRPEAPGCNDPDWSAGGAVPKGGSLPAWSSSFTQRGASRSVSTFSL